jgi:hypothetical protein
MNGNYLRTNSFLTMIDSYNKTVTMDDCNNSVDGYFISGVTCFGVVFTNNIANITLTH